MKTDFAWIVLLIMPLAQASRLPMRHITKKSPRIQGGDLAEPHSMPYLALLEFYNEYYATYCTGSLISHNYVISSGTCAASGSVEVLVTLGAHNIFITENTQVNVYSKEIKFHENYEEHGYLYDLVLIKLPHPVEYTDAIQAVNLPGKLNTAPRYTGQVGKIGGWGTDGGTTSQLFPLLRVIETEVLDNDSDDCSSLQPLPRSMLCISGEYKDKDVSPCDYDYGTSFVSDGVLIGVMSFGVIYCMKGYPSSFTRVDYYLNWIAENSDVVIR